MRPTLRRPKGPTSILVLALGLMLFASPSSAQGPYGYTLFDYPGEVLTHPYGINDAGVVVGSYFYGDHGFIRDAAGVFTTVDIPGSTETSVRGISNGDVSVGAYRLGLDFGYSYEAGVVTTMPALAGSPNFVANGINDDGTIVGRYRSASAQDHGYIYDGVDYITVDHPAGAHTVLSDIASDGTIVGSYWSGAQWHGFIYDGTTFTDLDKPGAYWTYLAGINDAGEIVGQEVDSTGMVRTAIHYDGAGTWTTLDVPGTWAWTGAQDINNAGVICGYAYVDGFDEEQGWIAEPSGAGVGPFRRGDVNGDGSYDIADAVTALSYLFQSLPIDCVVSADANDDDAVDVADAIWTLSALFTPLSPPPPAPHPDCGLDPTPGALDCAITDACP